MTVSVLITVEDSSPEISRCFNVDPDMTLGALAEVIDASLGFSGASSHLFVGKHGTQREVYAESPGAGEQHEDTITVAEMEPMTYIYDAAADWSIHVEVLGPSHIDAPTPMLVDAAGPDVIEACNGPAMMTEFRRQARLLAAGIEPDVDTVTLLFSFLPVMPPERMLDRLTFADPVTVASRMANVAEEQFFDEMAAAESEGLGLAERFDNFINSQPGLREILDVDPHPERNPAMISAVTDFFNSVLGEGTDFPELAELASLPGFAGLPGLEELEGLLDDTDDLEAPNSLTLVFGDLISLFIASVPYNVGELTPEVSREIRDITALPFPGTVVDFLLDAGLLKKRHEILTPTKAGLTFLSSDDAVAANADNLRRFFESIMGADLWRATVDWFIGEPQPNPDIDDYIPWLYGFCVVEEYEPGRSGLSDEGRAMMHLHRAYYEG